MKCQHCPKLATLQITELHEEDNFEEFHLCDECAQKLKEAHASAAGGKPARS